MMDSVTFLEAKLNQLFEQFPSSNIRYQHLISRRTHLIEVTPQSFYDDLDYQVAETLLEDEFERLFPNEEIVFISENSLSKISEAKLVLLSEVQGEGRSFVIELLGFAEFKKNEPAEYAEENNFAEAA